MDRENPAEQEQQQRQPSSIDPEPRVVHAAAAVPEKTLQVADDDSQVMADCCEQAVEAVLQGMEANQDWEVLRAIMDGEDEDEAQDEGEWDTADAEEAKKQLSLHASACCKGHPPSAGSVRPCQMSAYTRLDNAMTPIILACILSFVVQPLLMLLHKMALRVFPSPLRLLVGLEVPSLIVIKTFLFVLPVGVVSLFVEEMREAEDAVLTTAAFLIRLLVNVLLISSRGGNIPLLVTFFERMLARIVFTVLLYTYEGYSKYLVCQPRTLTGLYAPVKCVLPSWCKQALAGRDPKDTFLRASCLYHKLSMSDEGAMLQSHHLEYGHRLNNFARDNAVGACVWVSAMVLSVLMTIDMAKTLCADVAATWRFCRRYREQRSAGLTWRDAFSMAAKGTLSEAIEHNETAPSGSSGQMSSSQTSYGQTSYGQTSYGQTSYGQTYSGDPGVSGEQIPGPSFKVR
ncbi:uncharacterized protein LOC125946620 [Dermacentor silvarum]|uniref:uncharacterized protein LOC125946620 n=1 Tax=Dermacentor silvarum TaxID=543639 RepID=UPI002100CACA|nr:uncharacterized protein LOC125946620 [Dermacentor silvarum]